MNKQRTDEDKRSERLRSYAGSYGERALKYMRGEYTAEFSGSEADKRRIARDDLLLIDIAGGAPEDRAAEYASIAAYFANMSMEAA